MQKFILGNVILSEDIINREVLDVPPLKGAGG